MWTPALGRLKKKDFKRIMTFQYLFISFIVLFAVFIFEWIFHGCWNNTYYSIGIPLFYKKIHSTNNLSATKKINEIVQNFGKSKEFRDFKGKIINENIYYFRNKMNKKNPTFFHGNIKINAEDESITIKGFFTFSEILFFLWLILLHVTYYKDFGFISPYLFFYLIMLSNVGIKIWQYNKISNKLKN